ncbi:gene transfer agent family protein [Roseibium denhamense]|uniref:Phage tail tube protein, GTA-gp10 n=1 Tax=Roseibium denhamense TaxID=76305 RepID=A0ABY1PM10_9HYPH|nr:gene transfer agent family protein [Roseibium denhamense]MTI05712.1 gene transfer agent family protein [Roseibium denhamense]SMP36936.1 Phage tail tube protein, GTA-gp10 [Roseibium denhamense]
MANRIRGEISAQLDGRAWTLVLTLGALAELEEAFSCSSLSELLSRFSAGNLSARDMIRLLGAGLRGAGHDVSDDQLAMMKAPGGAAGFAAITADLLSATFGDPQESGDPMDETDGQAA